MIRRPRRAKSTNTKPKPKPRPDVPREYNMGTMTFAEVLGLVRAALREITYHHWKPRRDCLNSGAWSMSGKRYNTCERCKQVFERKHLQAHHLVGAGSMKDWADIGEFARRLLCERDGWLRVCKACHAALERFERNKGALAELDWDEESSLFNDRIEDGQ